MDEETRNNSIPLPCSSCEKLKERVAKLESTIRFTRSKIRMLNDSGNEIRDFLAKALDKDLDASDDLPAWMKEIK